MAFRGMMNKMKSHKRANRRARKVFPLPADEKTRVIQFAVIREIP